MMTSCVRLGFVGSQLAASERYVRTINLRNAFRHYQFQLPPLPEQKAIAAVLGALDDKIELNRRMNATLEAMARALFQSWFVDFDPVRAKLEGRPPAGLDEATAALFPRPIPSLRTRRNPGGVAICEAENVAQIGIGKTPPRKEPQWFSEELNGCSLGINSRHGELGCLYAEDIRVSDRRRCVSL